MLQGNIQTPKPLSFDSTSFRSGRGFDFAQDVASRNGRGVMFLF